MLKKILLLSLVSFAVFFNSQIAFGQYKLISSNLPGTNAGNLSSDTAFQSSDGRYVLFRSNATNLLTNSNNPYSQLYVRDLETRNLELVSVNYSQTGAANYDSWVAKISGNGRHVVFFSQATDLVQSTSGTRPSNNQLRLFVRNLETGTTYRIQPPILDRTIGEYATANSYFGRTQISFDGRFVAYNIQFLKSRVPFPNRVHLLGQKASWQNRVYVWDRETGQNQMVNTNVPLRFDISISSNFWTMTPDGRFVLFINSSSDLPRETTPFLGFFVRDMLTGEIEPIDLRVSDQPENLSSASNMQISDDGRYIAFQHNLSDYPNNNYKSDVFILDRISKTTRLVSANYLQTASSNNKSELLSMSPDGRFVVFRSKAKDLIPNPPIKHDDDVYVWDALDGSKICVTRDIPNFGSLPNKYPQADISGDGENVMIHASMQPQPSNLRGEIFVFNTVTNQTNLVSNFPGSTTLATGFVGLSSISKDGRRIIFETSLSLLPIDNNNGYSDIYSYSFGKGF